MQKQPPHIIFGLLTSAVLMLCISSIYLYKVNVTPNAQTALLAIIIAVGVLVSCYFFASQNAIATPLTIFINGFRTTAIIAVILIVFGVVIISTVPSIKQNMVTIFATQLQVDNTTNTTPQAAIDAQVAQYKSRFTTLFVGLNTMRILIAGAVSSAVAVVLFIFTQKKKTHA